MYDEIEWVDEGEYLNAYRGGELVRCGVCGEPAEFSLGDGSCLHKCEDIYLDAIARLAQRDPGFTERLSLGFAMLAGDHDAIYSTEDPDEEGES
jgi:hypothetical protein